MSVFFLDRVTRTAITTDSTYGNKTEVETKNIKAYVELEDKIERGIDGTPIRPYRFVMLPKGTVLNKGDFITLTKRSGKAVSGNDAVRREVLEILSARGISISHLEIKCQGNRVD